MGLLRMIFRALTPVNRIGPPPTVRAERRPQIRTEIVSRTVISVETRRPAPVETQRKIVGRAYVIDGDTIVIQKARIRIGGIDAPELDHPYGQKSKFAMVSLCKGQVVTATVKETDVHGRVVATCHLPDGRDVAAELVKMGLAIDWPKYSGGKYSRFEPAGIRKRLWRADLRQRGRMIH
ncbi:thermonuclease family protein [Pseudoruegeria sp. HB172150]|uniref:thermonuclease family protein n=1 Tax=Pseudoruegeria sp. HB172150 TaxID=2721164 RepID=UPI0020A6A96A|nr:thermonuclease family protein [Pseudoruegeria sp. HB172150]